MFQMVICLTKIYKILIGLTKSLVLLMIVYQLIHQPLHQLIHQSTIQLVLVALLVTPDLGRGATVINIIIV